MLASLRTDDVSRNVPQAQPKATVVRPLVSAQLWGENFPSRAANEIASNDRECQLHAARGGHKMHTRRTARQMTCLSDFVVAFGRAPVSRLVLRFPLTFNRAETGRWLSPSIKIFLAD